MEYAQDPVIVAGARWLIVIFRPLRPASNLLSGTQFFPGVSYWIDGPKT
jgi:hypothetical protein